MSNTGALIGAIAALLAGTLATVQFARSSFGQRYQIRRDLEILRDLPEGAARARLAASIEASVELLVDREALRRPTPPLLVALTFVYLLAAAGAFSLAALLNVWWLYLVGAYIVAAVVAVWVLRLLRSMRLGRVEGRAVPVEIARPGGDV